MRFVRQFATFVLAPTWCRFLTACLVSTLSTSPVLGAPCAGSDLQGTVFGDYNADGARSSGNTEVGISGVVITAISDDGSSATCETLADGSFGIDAPIGGFPVRVEATLPAGFPWDALEPGASGLTTVFFAAASASGLDVGFNAPLDYCQANPDVMAACFLQGNPLFPGSDSATADTLVSVDYDRTAPIPAHLALGADVGAIWGLGYQRSSDSLFVTAVLRRHAGFGPLGLGGIYRVVDPSGAPVVSSFVEASSLGVPIGTDPRSVPGEDPPGGGPTGNEPGLDNLTYEEIGKVGLGDLDVEENAGRLWVMNLGDSNLYSMNIGPTGNVPASATMFSLPAVACTDGVFRPWAVKSYRGRIYVGGVCSNENISPYPAPGGFIDFPNLVGFVYSMDPADGIFSLEMTIPLNYPKGCAGGATGCQWYPWTDLSTAVLVATPTFPSHPTPILSDIEFADDGDMIIGITDRTGFQYGSASPLPNGMPTDTTVATVFAGGDMLRADFDAVTGSWTLESNGIAGGVVGAGSGNSQGPGGGEYYSASTAGFHFELSQGGYAVLRGSNQFVGSAMDPVTINSGGLLWMHELGATPGAMAAGYTLFDITTPSGFRKGAGVGDVELRCDLAPIEIGNRVWDDLDFDGIQDPGEPALPSVDVTLVCAADGINVSTATDANGEYLFNAGNVAGGIPPGAACELRIDPADPDLGGRIATLANAGSDLHDSDGVPLGGFVGAAINIGAEGFNNHTHDFGFFTVPTIGSIGDTVWCDGFAGTGNSTFDAGEGVADVTVELFDDTDCDNVADGAAIATQATVGDGQYLFTALAVGLPGLPMCYVVRVDAADGDLGNCNSPITPVEFQPDLDTSTPELLTADFGFEEPLGTGSIGDTVWCDGLEGTGNTTFDAGEGVANITVELFDDTDCDNVADGGVISTQSTVGDGQYLFTGLPIGPPGSPVCYVVRVDAADADLGTCDSPINPVELQPDLDINTRDDLANDFGFEELCVDTDGDGICNESCSDDRDNDGIPDCDDFDPQGYLYCESTGEILPGGGVDVSGPGVITLVEDGLTGRYVFFTDGTAGVYTMSVTPPPDATSSANCLDQGVLDPTGNPSPLTLGAGELADSGLLGSAECLDNPFYLTFDLEPGDPQVINNNIPFQMCGPPPVVEIPTVSEWGLALLALLLAAAGAALIRRQ